jgi:multiple sugar transport system substrate-binding protein
MVSREMMRGTGDAIVTLALDRRTFLAMSGGVGLAGILASGRAPAHAQGTTITILRSVDPIPAGDEVLARQMTEASRVFGATVALDRVDARDLAARVSAAASAGTGPDIVELRQNGPYLYEKHLVDVTDVAEEIERPQAGFHSACEVLCKVAGRWRAVPHAIRPNLVVYRPSLYEQAGFAEFPKTWRDGYDAGRVLKGRGFPIGQTVAHTLMDGPAFWYPLLWCWGAKEVESDGKTVALDTSAAVESVRFAVGFWQDCCDPRGLAWADAENARAFLAGTNGSTLGTASIYLTALDDPRTFKTATGAPLHTDIRYAPLPASSVGRFSYHRAFHHGVMSYSKSSALAKDVLRYLHARERFEPWFVAERGYAIGPTRMWEQHALWTRDPVMLPFREAARTYRLIGFSGRPTAKASQVLSSQIVVDMYAKAIRGMLPENAVTWAAGALQNIYG